MSYCISKDCRVQIKDCQIVKSQKIVLYVLTYIFLKHLQLATSWSLMLQGHVVPYSKALIFNLLELSDQMHDRTFRVRHGFLETARYFTAHNLPYI